MKSKMISVVVSIFATTTLLAETGTVVYAVSKADAEILKELQDGIKVQVYRLELHTSDAGEQTYIVGGDGVKRPVVLVDPSEYKLLTERLESVWQSFHATADGRRKLHGRLERTEINEKARQKVEIYADGFRYTETLPVKRKPTEAKITRLQAKIEEQKPKGMSDRQWKVRQAFKKHRLGVPKQVTVEHNAVTGKDTVVK